MTCNCSSLRLGLLALQPAVPTCPGAADPYFSHPNFDHKLSAATSAKQPEAHPVQILCQLKRSPAEDAIDIAEREDDCKACRHCS